MKLRFGFIYGLSWAVFYALYGLMLVSNPNTSLFDAVRAAFFTVIPAALAGLIVWRLTRALPWPAPNRLKFFSVHAVASILYAASWAGFTLVQISLFAPGPVLMIFVQRALGWQLMMGLLIYGVIAGIGYLVQMAGRLAEQRTLASRAELQALRGQLDPHFLFNTLHSVAALVRQNPAAAEDALVRFGSLLRYVLDSSRRDHDDTTVEEELTFVRGYLEIEKLRLGARLEVAEEIDPDALDCIVPMLTLQPLVENAVRHGIAPRADGGTVRISARLLESDLVIAVGDDGGGSTDEALHTATGVGLALVKRRLEARFAEQASMVVETAPGSGFTVTLSVPARAMTSRAIAAAKPWQARRNREIASAAT